MKQASSSTGFETPERRALQEFLTWRTLPLISHTDAHVWFQGTGSLFKRGEHSYLVTAAHVFDNAELSDVNVPLGRGRAEIASLSQCTLYRSSDKDDVAVVKLDVSLARQLRNEWIFLDDSNVEICNASHESFLVAGFPSVTGITQIDGIRAEYLTQLFTGRYRGPDAVSWTQGDLLLTYKHFGKDNWFGTKETPKLEGISGAPTWIVKKQNSPVWNPEAALRLTGLQVSYMHSSFVRVKSWQLVDALICAL